MNQMKSEVEINTELNSKQENQLKVTETSRHTSNISNLKKKLNILQKKKNKPQDLASGLRSHMV